MDQTPEAMKIRLVFMYLKGKALHWHQAVMKDLNGASIDWKTYVEELEEHFQGGMITKPLIALRNLKLTTTVHEYNSDFNSLRNQVELPNEVLIDLYLGGLPNELFHTVQLLDPKSLSHAMRLARLQEGAYYAIWGLEPPKSDSATNHDGPKTFHINSMNQKGSNCF